MSRPRPMYLTSSTGAVLCSSRRTERWHRITPGAWTRSRSTGNVLTAETLIVSARPFNGWNMPTKLLRQWGIRGNQ
jgi:hypothetical protein